MEPGLRCEQCNGSMFCDDTVRWTCLQCGVSKWTYVWREPMKLGNTDPAPDLTADREAGRLFGLDEAEQIIRAHARDCGCWQRMLADVDRERDGTSVFSSGAGAAGDQGPAKKPADTGPAPDIAAARRTALAVAAADIRLLASEGWPHAKAVDVLEMAARRIEAIARGENLCSICRRYHGKEITHACE